MQGDAILKVACIGAGYFSQFHLQAWRRIDAVQLVAAVDQHLHRAEQTGLRAYTDCKQMLYQEQPDIVDIITPPATHLEIIHQAIEAQPRMIVCQKPFCQDRAQTRQVISLSEAHGVPIVVHENFRFQPWYRMIKHYIQQGDLGQVLQLSFRLRPGDGQGPRAYLDRQPYFQTMEKFLVRETAVHWIDTFRYLLGEPETVFADLRRLNPAIAGEDAGYIVFGFANGARALFDGNRLLDHPALDRRCTMGEAMVEGTRASLSLDGAGELRIRAFGHLHSKTVLPAQRRQDFGGDCVHALQQHLVDALLEDHAPENLAQHYLRNLDIQEAIYRSATQGQRIAV